jgi:hypothetical protein
MHPLPKSEAGCAICLLQFVCNPASLPSSHQTPPQGTNEISRLGVYNVAGNGWLESHSAYIKQPEATLPQLRRVLYDQYEVSCCLHGAAGGGGGASRPVTTVPGIKAGRPRAAPTAATAHPPTQVSFPFAVAGDCFTAALETVYGADLDGKDMANR